MKFDTEIVPDLSSARAAASAAEQDGYNAVWTAEIGHNPFFPLLLAAEATRSVSLGTGIAVAFARSPMTLASSAWDLNAFSEGRFLLGLGSQIKPHIERRYSMPWSAPAARMREFICALHAIWDCWQDGTPLNFEGEFYTHTIMTPFFNPGPTAYGAPPVILAAVGEGMTKVAAEVADGMLVHGFTTERYLREVTLGVIEAGLKSSGRTRADFQLIYPALVVTGDTEQDMDVAATGTRKQIAFYGSTPSYRPILEAHGWGDLQEELHTLSKRGEWDAMGDLITDDILDAFAVTGTPETIPALLTQRFGDIIDRIRLYTPYQLGSPEIPARILAAFRG